MHVGEIGRIGAEHRRREVMPQRRLDGLDRFVRPGLYRHRLSPALGAGVVGEANDDRRAHIGLEELELADQPVVQAADFDADDPAHHRC